MNYYYFLVFLVARALASPNGAPQQACSSMTPGHGYNPQTKSSPFIVLPLTVYTRYDDYFIVNILISFFELE